MFYKYNITTLVLSKQNKMKKEKNNYADFEQSLDVISRVINKHKAIQTPESIKYSINEKQFKWLMSVYTRELYKTLAKGEEITNLDAVKIMDIETGKYFTFGYKIKELGKFLIILA